MQDDIEDFIRAHSEEFDVNEPSPQGWKRLAKKLHPVKWYRRPLFAAAGIAALLAIAATAWHMEYRSRQQQLAMQLQVAVPAGTEAYYAAMVTEKRTELNRYCTAYPDLCSDLNSEINALDTMYAQLKIEYKNSNGNQAVVQAMIANLQERVQLLTRQLQMVEQIKQEKQKGKPGLM